MPRTSFKEDLDRIVEAIIYLVTESRRLSKDEASQYGVTPTQLSVLKLLQQIGDLSLGTLSREIGAHNSTVTGIVDRMESAGLVERDRSEEDRRVWIIRLTSQGRRVAERAKVSPWELLRGALAALPPSDQERLTSILKKLVGHVTSQVEESGNGTRR
jgi:MarR family transcriptional regulator, organic hydroperoxide resistance regulator